MTEPTRNRCEYHGWYDCNPCPKCEKASHGRSASSCSLSHFHYVTPKQWNAVIRHLRQYAREIQMDDLGKADAFVAAADFIKANGKDLT